MTFNWIYVTFILYLLLLVFIGIYFARRSKNLEDYLLGGRGMGSWVTALSAQASDMSGWLLMGLPGAVFLFGMGECWIGVGLAVGTLLNWLIVAPRLRNYTAKLNSLTLSSFFSRRFHEPYNLLRVTSTVFTLFFFTIYTASGLVAAGKLFETTFNWPYHTAMLIGAGVLVFYTMLGGFMAVCWTDLFQGILMFLAIITLPIIALMELDGVNIAEAVAAKGASLSLFMSGTTELSALAIISTAAWGLGYFGQPHILVRFMSIRSIRILPRTITIAMIWVVLSLAGAMAVGILAIPLFPELTAGDSEKVFMLMIEKLMHPALAGVFLAAILAAAMSTVDSQLLVCSSSLTEDVYVGFIRPRAKACEQMWISRACIILIAVLACFMAWNKDNSIFELVKNAWSGFGSVFGPVVLTALFCRKAGWVAAFCGMLAGAATWGIWLMLGWNSWCYEIIPGFLLNFAIIIILSVFMPNKNLRIEEEFNDVKESVKNKSDIA